MPEKVPWNQGKGKFIFHSFDLMPLVVPTKWWKQGLALLGEKIQLGCDGGKRTVWKALDSRSSGSFEAALGASRIHVSYQVPMSAC